MLIYFRISFVEIHILFLELTRHSFALYQSKPEFSNNKDSTCCVRHLTPVYATVLTTYKEGYVYSIFNVKEGIFYLLNTKAFSKRSNKRQFII